MSEKITAPWTTEQVEALNEWQQLGRVHPFTCPNSHPLVATPDGWVCIPCAYMQDWAHDFMCDKAKHPTSFDVDIASFTEPLQERIDDLIEALQSISQWADAYPLPIFPEPDLAKAAKLLNDGGITLDAISAHCMRHVIAGVGAIAKKALGEQ